MINLFLTPKEMVIFKGIADLAPWNHDGTKTKSDNAVLGSLVKKGLLVTMEDESRDIRTGRKIKKIWVSFTDAGVKFADSIGMNKGQF